MYNPVPWQTDDTPEITASGERVKEGMVANNCLEFGDWVEIDGVFYRVADRMNSRYGCQYFDILSFDLEEASSFGSQRKEVLIYKQIKSSALKWGYCPLSVKVITRKRYVAGLRAYPTSKTENFK